MICYADDQFCRVVESGLEQLLAIMEKLRKECPWDQAQTPESLTQYAIEEAYEVE